MTEGAIIIEWPPARTALQKGAVAPLWSCLVSIYDAFTGDQITTASSADIVIHADAARCVTADLTLFTDEAGNPVFDASVIRIRENGDIETDVFTFFVSEMRERSVQQRKPLPAPAGLRHRGLRRYRNRNLERGLER